jgi:dTDP-4-dehydrorhamnose reductase
MPLLLFGKNGQVGFELRRTLAPLDRVVALDVPEVDFTSPDSIRGCVHETRPSIIVNAAAYTAVDRAESESDRAYQINAIAPGILAEEARRIGALLIHFSSDYVHPGTKNTPSLEDDAAGPLSAYGKSKLAGDIAIQQSGCAHYIFRPCWVYGARAGNFMLTMMRLAREREELRVVRDQVGAPTWSRLIAEATALVLKQTSSAEAARPYQGVYHLCASGSTSWHGFAKAIIHRMPADAKKCPAVEPISTCDYPTPARRPAYSVMSCAKLQRAFGLSLPHWEETLDLVLEDFKLNY